MESKYSRYTPIIPAGVSLVVLNALWLCQFCGQPLLAQGKDADRVVQPVRTILLREFHAAGLDTSTDGLGSVIGVLSGPAGAPRVMLAAHMDEVGAMVKYVTPEGMVKFQLLGGWLDQSLVDQPWAILTKKGPVSAISGKRSVHVTPPDEFNRVTARDDVFLDVGARSKAEAEALGIRPGDPIVPASEFTEMANHRYVGKALDDRVGCVMLIEALRRLTERNAKLPATIYFVGTVQEEVGLRGAHTAVPDLGISLEAGIAADHPGGRPDWAQERLGGGPVLYFADARMLVNLKLRDFFERVATESGIAVQTEVTTGGAEDSAELQHWGTGRPSINLAVATRYLRGHHSMIERTDLDQTIALLVTALSKLDRATVSQIASFE